MFLKKLFLLASLLALVGCGAESEKGGGSIVGNGLNSYSNSVLNVSFDYPASWALSESADREEVELSNAPLNPEGPPSVITFKRLKELGGNRIYSQSDLEAALKRLEPGEDWKPAEFVGRRHGFVSRKFVGPGNMTKAKYYVLDENYNILFVNYVASPEFGGEDIVYAVLGSVVIDLDPPELFNISISPAKAHPGEEVTVTIVAVDDASGVDGDYFVQPSIDLQNLQQNWFGYNVKHYPYDVNWWGTYSRPEAPWMNDVGNHVKKAFEPAQAFPFRHSWQRVTKVRFSYTFRVPRNAPRGEVVIGNIALRDLRGNGVIYTLEPETDRERIAPANYTTSYQVRRQLANGKPFRLNTNLKAASFEIIGGGSLEDAGASGGIQVRDLFWDNSLLRVPSYGSARNALFARLESPGDLVASLVDAPKILAPGCTVKDYSYEYDVGNTPFLGDGQFPTISQERAGLWKFDRMTYPGQGQCDDKPTNSTAVLRRVYFRDELGNMVSVAQESPKSYESGDYNLPLLGRPVLFQMSW